jgi:mono/diheme cytochrome c family protein
MRALLLAFVIAFPAAASAEDAKPAYDKMCASCHGADGTGNPAKAKVLKIDPELLNLGRPEAAGLSRDELKDRLLNGKAKMPAYAKKLKAEQVEPMLDYVMQLAAAIRGEKK